MVMIKISRLAYIILKFGSLKTILFKISPKKIFYIRAHPVFLLLNLHIHESGDGSMAKFVWMAVAGNLIRLPAGCKLLF